jgi:hypothetical protein
MKKDCIILLLLFFFIYNVSSSQDFSITTPVVDFDGTQLAISYDIIIEKATSAKFFVWVEIEKMNGEQLQLKNISGDIGDIYTGTSKKIIWIPEKDSIFLNENVLVEIKAEKYVKSFNKGSAILLSTVLPGLGQTKISKGKPWWLAGVSAYGLLAGGFIVHKNYLNSYDSYRFEEDPSRRVELLDQAQQQLNLSSALVISGASIWAANLIWVTMIPNRYQTLKHLSFSINSSPGRLKPAPLLTMQINF